MNRAALKSAAPLAHDPSPARRSMAPVGARRHVSILDSIDLPLWANILEARELLERIIVEQPERTKPLTQLATGQTASFGYRGKAANALRTLYAAFEADRLDWLAEVPFNSEQWHKRRNAIIAYERAHGADALISRVLRAVA
jgi:hypothetical protein